MKLTKNIDLREVVPPEIYELYTDLAVDFIDMKIVNIAQRILDISGKSAIVINDWHYNKNKSAKTLRGYRPPDCPVGAKFSEHKKGRALDFDIKGMTAVAVRQLIRDNRKELYQMGLRRIEDNVAWVHIDLKEIGFNDIYFFKP